MIVTYERRSTIITVGGKGVQGWRGYVTINGASWPTIERADPGMDDGSDGVKALPPGLYDLEFGHIRQWRIIADQSGTKRRVIRESKAIRVLGAFSRGRIYFHVANHPYQLEGCIAPGMREKHGGVARSRVALEQMMNALGGFVLGASAGQLEVVGEGPTMEPDA